MKPRLTFFSPYYVPYVSGITTYPQKVFKRLAQEYHITVLTFRHEANLPSSQSQDGYQIIRINPGLRLSKGFISPHSLRIFAAYLHQTDVLILNIPNVEAVPLVYMAHRKKIPIISIYHCHISLPKSFSNHIIQSVINHAVRYQLTQSDHIIAYTKEYVKSIAMLKQFQAKISYVLPPVTVSHPDHSRLKQLLHQKAHRFWIGYAGRIASEKGINILIDAVQRLDFPYSLVFAGPQPHQVVGESKYAHQIINRLKSSNIPHIFLGNLSGSTLASFYRSIDVLILPSINQTEAFGMVQAEAMLNHTPVIATDLPGVNVPIRLTNMGILVPAGESHSLTKAISKIHDQLDKYTVSSVKLSQYFNNTDTAKHINTIITRYV